MLNGRPEFACTIGANVKSRSTTFFAGDSITPESTMRRFERSVRRMASDGKKDCLIVKVHPEVALYVLEHEHDLIHKLEKSVGFSLDVRDDPLLKPDEFKLVVKGAERDVTQQYAMA